MHANSSEIAHKNRTPDSQRHSSIDPTLSPALFTVRPARFAPLANIRLERPDHPQIEDRHAIAPNRDRIAVANPKANILGCVSADLVHRCRKHWVAGFERHEYPGFLFQHPVRIVTMKWALLVENMHQRPRKRKDRLVCPLEAKLL